MLYHAFAPIAADGSTQIYTTNGISRSQLAAEYKARLAQGKPTLLSVGGEGGSASGLWTPESQQRFIATVTPLIDEFGFSGIDWDLELNIPGGISAQGIAAVSRALRAKYPSLMITMAPFGHPDIDPVYKALAKDLNSTGDLTYVGYQFYNDISAPTADAVISTMASWIAATGIRPDQFVIGLWYGPDDWMGNVTTIDQMKAIWGGVTAVYPTVRGVYTWGIRTTDMAHGFPFSTEMATVVGG